MIDEILRMIDQLGALLKAFKIDLIFSIIVNVIIIVALFKLTDLFIGKLKEKTKGLDNSILSGHLIPILEKLIKLLVVFFVVASLLQSNGYSITSLIAGFGITGLAVGFAAQQTVADFFGTLAIIADKMYKIGEYVKINDVEGVVEDINLLSTKIRTLDNFLVIVPNNLVSNTTVTNVTRAKKRRINEIFGVTYDTSDKKLQEAIEIIKAVCEEHEDVHKDAVVFTERLSSSSIDIKLLAYTRTNNYNRFMQIKSEIILEVVKRFRKAKISFAFPSQSIYIEKK